MANEQESNPTEIRINAMLQELSTQRAFLGDRAVSSAGQIAVLTAENNALKKEIEALKAAAKKDEAPA